MKSYDVKRELKHLYAPRNATWALLDVPEQQFLAIDGSGNPNTTAEYAAAVEALYTVAYTLKFSTENKAAGTSSSPRWKDCGGPTIPRRSPPAQKTAGTGQC